MTAELIGEVRRVGLRLESDRWWTAVPSARLELLARTLHDVLVVDAGSSEIVEDALLTRVISSGLETFLLDPDRPRHAASTLGPLLGALGAREAVAGRSFDELAALFGSARRALVSDLPELPVDVMPPTVVRTLRTRLLEFLDELLRLSRAGYDAASRLDGLSAEGALTGLRRVLFDHRDRHGLSARALAKRAGLRLPDEVVAVVAVGEPLPEAWSCRTDAVVDATGREAVVGEALGGCAPVDVVVGPPIELDRVSRSLTLARRAARLVTTGRAERRGVVRCDDVVTDLIGDDELVERMLAQRLQPLDALSPRRRADLAEVLLEWLGTGCTVNDLARRLGQHRQTVHSKVRRLRALFGDDLDDPDRRLELLLALRAETPLDRK